MFILHYLIILSKKNILIELKQRFKANVLFILLVMIQLLSSRLKSIKGITTVLPEVCEALIFLLDNIYIRYGTKLHRQIVGIPMGTNVANIVADLFVFCSERDLMMSLSADKDAKIIEAFSSTSRYLEDLLYIILIIPVLTVWSKNYTHQNFN